MREVPLIFDVFSKCCYINSYIIESYAYKFEERGREREREREHKENMKLFEREIPTSERLF